MGSEQATGQGSSHTAEPWSVPAPTTEHILLCFYSIGTLLCFSYATPCARRESVELQPSPSKGITFGFSADLKSRGYARWGKSQRWGHPQWLIKDNCVSRHIPKFTVRLEGASAKLPAGFIAGGPHPHQPGAQANRLGSESKGPVYGHSGWHQCLQGFVRTRVWVLVLYL